MKQGIKIIGGVLLAAALSSPAWAKHGNPGGPPESMAGGLPALEDRVDAQQLQIDDLLGQNNFATVTETLTTCTLVHSSPSVVSATFIDNGDCEITFSKDVSACSAVATIVGDAGGEISVTSTTKTNSGDSWEVSTFPVDGAEGFANFNLTVTCP
jgi:hypothetical protein